MGTLFLLTRDLGLLWLATAWTSSAAWVWRDARGRLTPRAALAATTAAAALPVAGALLWLCLRPVETPAERRERRLRRRLLEEIAADAPRCLVCRTPLAADFACCPGCGIELSRRCDDCGATLRATWHACPWCAAEHDAEPAVASAA